MSQIIEREYTTATTLAAGTFTEADIGRLFLNRADGQVFRCISTTPKLQHVYALNNSEYTITYAATVTPNLLNGVNQKVTLTGNVALAVPSVTAGVYVGARFRIRIIQDGTGSRTITFGSGYHAAGGNPTESVGANAVDILEATYNGTVWNCTFSIAQAAMG